MDLRGKHNNPFFLAGFPSIQKAMIENNVRFPNKKLTVKHVLGDGGLVAVHSYITLRPGRKRDSGRAPFRFEGDRIVEMWDIGQPVPGQV